MDYNLNNIKDKILWVCPTRGRPEKLQKMLDSFYDTTEGDSDLLIAIDSDDRSYDKMMFHDNNESILWEVNDPIGGKFLHLLNKMALKYVDDYKYIGFMEDDVILRTDGYEKVFIEKLKELGDFSLVHGNDGINTPRLVSLPVLTSKLVKTLGFFAPPELNCLWADYFWRELANTGLVREHYFPEIVIQHMHYSVIDNIPDQTAINMEQVAIPDFPGYHSYIKSKFHEDIKKLRK